MAAMEKKGEPLKIGTTVARADARAKVTGQEKYAADYYAHDFLWAGVKRAGIPHAILKNIHTETTRNMPGIIAVLTWKDVPGSNRIGIIRKDEPVLVDERIRRCGDAIALVLAENREILGKAIEHITFEYEPLPGVFDPEDALKDGAPMVQEENPEGNIIRTVSVETGKGAFAFNDCDVVIEETFEVPYQEHAYLETEAGWAYLGQDGKLVIVASTQTPFRDCAEIAPALGLDVSRLRVIAPYLGGAFGGKDGITVQCLLGLAALYSSGRSVKMWWDREESFLAGVKRLPAKMYYKVGATRDGTLHALSCRLYFNGGAYTSLGGEIMTLAAEHAGSAYRIPHVSIKGWCIHTNNPVGGPFRGFGVPQVTAAMEQMVDMLAHSVAMDPLEIRLKNALHRGDKNCLGVTLVHSTGVEDCLEVLSGHSMWKEKETWKTCADPFKRRGVGIACMAHAMGYPPIVPDFANAKIEITMEGKIRVYAGIVDMGQGNASTYLQIAGDILGQDASSMELVLPDTEHTLPCGSSSASRTTYTYGNALVKASHTMKNRILEKASIRFAGSPADEFALMPGRVRHLPTGQEIPSEELAKLFGPSERVCIDYFQTPVVEGMRDTIYMGPHIIFSYGAHCVHVEVDTLTGEIEVKKYLAVTDAGKVLNPQTYEQQIQGSIAQGIGYALSEDYKVSNGRSETGNLSTYIIPTSMDVPDMTSIPVETNEETGPLGMKGVGEVAMSGPLPAIANAVADACKIRIFSGPLISEKILRALGDSEENEDSP